MSIHLSRHARERVESRLSDFVTVDEVDNTVWDLDPEVGKTVVFIKRLDEKVVLDETSETGQIVNGDEILAVIRRADEEDPGAVASVLLRDHNQGSRSIHENHRM